MDAATRRQLAREARDAFPPMGVFAMVDRVTGRARIGASRNAPAALQRAQFELRMNAHRDKVLQAAWAAGGAERIRFEVLALLKERDDPAHDYDEELRTLEALYRDEYAANDHKAAP
jgi:hypothetical protein